MTSLDAAWDAEDTAITEIGGDVSDVVQTSAPGQPPRLRSVAGRAAAPSWSHDGEAQDTAVLPRADLDALVDRTSRARFQTGETESIREGQLAELLDDDDDDDRPRAQVPSAPPPPPSWGALPDAPTDAERTEEDAESTEDDEPPPFRAVALESQSSAELTVKRAPFDLSAYDSPSRGDPVDDVDDVVNTDEVATRIERAPVVGPGDRRRMHTLAGGLVRMPDGVFTAVPAVPAARPMAPAATAAEMREVPAPEAPPSAGAAAAAWIQAATSAGMSAGMSAPFSPSPSFNPPPPSEAASREGIVVPSVKLPQHTELSHALLTPAGTPPATPGPASPSANRRTAVILGVAGLACVAAVALLVSRAMRSADATPAPATAAPTSGLVLPAGAPQPPPAGPADDEVRAALGKLREGIKACVKTIGVLPGSSPAIPASFAQLSASGVGGAYASTSSDWKTPVWACTHFSMDRAQRFQLQWQQDKVRTKGMAVAWLDGDADGKADKAFGFAVTLKKKGEVEVGEIEPIAADRPLAPKP